MAKSRAEIQKAYRERNKAEGAAFLEKERLRQQHNYVPSSQLPKRKRVERNLKNKHRNRLSRVKARANRDVEPIPEETSGYDSMPSETPGPSMLIVKLPIPKKSVHAMGIRKVNARARARASKQIKMMKADMVKLRKKLKLKNRKIQRMESKMDRLHSKNVTPKVNATPSKQTDIDIKKLNLTPRRSKNIRRKLLMSNTVMSEIAQAKLSSTTKKRQNLHRVVSGVIAKKYRCLRMINKATGLCRRSLGRVVQKGMVIVKESREVMSNSVKSSVLEFLSRDDNSRAQPGKADVKKLQSGEKRQTRVLTDYMKHLHSKYRSENPDKEISLATFCRLRPNNILLTSFISRNSCQCIHHQNMALKVQAMRKCGVKISENPEHLIGNKDIESVLEIIPDIVVFNVWKKVEVENGRMKMKVVEEQSNSDTFRSDFKIQLDVFEDHVTRVRDQYEQVRLLKENLPKDEMMVQMDYAENFSCRSLNEIQTAYFSQSMVTIHPAVIYYREDGELKHQSLVVVSDEMSHAASTVCAFLDQIIPQLKEINPQVKFVHYWTDSPSSQYRNRYIFHTLVNHKDIYGVDARWNYFEVGHGKGPCDGLGGTTKRMADEAIRQGHVIIQDAPSFYRWAEKSTMKGVKFLFVPKMQTMKKHAAMTLLNVTPVKGTMKLHAIGTRDNMTLMTRETSCYCSVCLTGAYCDSWSEQQLHTESHDPEPQPSVVSTTETSEQSPINAESSNETHQTSPTNHEVGSYVAAIYDGMWYIGKIESQDADDINDYEINFMSRAKTLYKWPQHKDCIWIDGSNILCQIKSLEPSGKSRRLYRISSEENQKIMDIFTTHAYNKDV